MPDTTFPSYRPPNALVLWTDTRWIYVELPKREGGTCIIKYPYNSIGLSKVLALLGNQADIAGAPLNVPLPTSKIKSETPQSAQAQRILRQMGMIK